MSDFGLQLRAARKRVGLTQAEAASVLDMSPEWVSQCERGLSVPPAITREGALARLRRARKRTSREGRDKQVEPH